MSVSSIRSPSPHASRGAPLVAAAARTVACGLAVGLLACGAHAEPLPVLDKASLWVGGFVADTDGEASLRDSTKTPPLDTGTQTILSGTKTVARLRADALLFPKQGLAVDYLRFRGKETNPISLGYSTDYLGTTISGVGEGSLTADTQVDMLNLAWRWWFGDERNVWGVGLGIGHYKLNIDAVATASDTVALPFPPFSVPVTVTWNQPLDESTTAPLLTLGWRRVMSDQIRLYADFSGAKSVDNQFSGHVLNASAGVEWFPWPNFGFGAEYGYTRMHVTREGNGVETKFDLKLHGPTVFLRARY